MTKAIYAFSGDPITYGHIDLIKRAAQAFEQVIVGIGINPGKNYLFSLDERTEMARRSVSSIPNAQVVSFRGLLVDYAYEQGIKVIVKGVRNTADFDYENTLHQAGESQKLGIDTHVLFSRPELAHVSSTIVKSLQKEQGLIHELVPLYVKQCLEAKVSGQYIVGVTGEVGAGKSYISQKLIELGAVRGIPVHNLELDHIGHQILGELQEPKYEEVRRQVAQAFGPQVQSPDGTIYRRALGEVVFNDPAQLKKLDEIMYTPLLVRLRRELYEKKGLVLFNAALIAESHLTYLCNNNVILLQVDKPSQERRLAGRGLTAEQIQRRLASQFTHDQKREKIQEAIDKDHQGQIWHLPNSDGNSEEEIRSVFEAIVRDLNVRI